MDLCDCEKENIIGGGCISILCMPRFVHTIVDSGKPGGRSHRGQDCAPGTEEPRRARAALSRVALWQSGLSSSGAAASLIIG